MSMIGAVSYTSMYRVHVFETRDTTVCIRLRLTFSDVRQRLILYGSHVARLTKLVFGMLTSSIIRVCSCIDTTLSGPRVSLSKLLCVAFAITLSQCVAVT